MSGLFFLLAAIVFAVPNIASEVKQYSFLALGGVGALLALYSIMSLMIFIMHLIFGNDKEDKSDESETINEHLES